MLAAVTTGGQGIVIAMMAWVAFDVFKATVEIENIGQRPYIRRVFNITITYDTPPEKVTRACSLTTSIPPL